MSSVEAPTCHECGYDSHATPDEELKIIVFSPFVLHYSNEVLRLLTSAGLEGVVTCVCRTRFPTVGCGVVTHTFATRGPRLPTHRFPTHIMGGE